MIVNNLPTLLTSIKITSGAEFCIWCCDRLLGDWHWLHLYTGWFGYVSIIWVDGGSMARVILANVAIKAHCTASVICSHGCWFLVDLYYIQLGSCSMGLCWWIHWQCGCCNEGFCSVLWGCNSPGFKSCLPLLLCMLCASPGYKVSSCLLCASPGLSCMVCAFPGLLGVLTSMVCVLSHWWTPLHPILHDAILVLGQANCGIGGSPAGGMVCLVWDYGICCAVCWLYPVNCG